MESSSGPSARAVRHVRQPADDRAFVPAPLPPEPPIRVDGELQVLLSQADRALGRLDGSVVTLPNPELFVFMFVRKEAVFSSQIEGTQSSLQDVLAAEADLFDSLDVPRDADEVSNYVRAMNHGLARLSVRRRRHRRGGVRPPAAGARLRGARRARDVPPFA